MRCYVQEETRGRLRDEGAIVKGAKLRPVFKPSKLEEQAGRAEAGEPAAHAKRPGSAKRSKTQSLAIHEEKIIQPDRLPAGSRFKGYDDYTVQELVLQAHNLRSRLACWLTPEGEWRRGQLPEAIHGGHLGPYWVSSILYPHHQGQVTQPLLLEQLRAWGIDISAGQIDQ